MKKFLLFLTCCLLLVACSLCRAADTDEQIRARLRGAVSTNSAPPALLRGTNVQATAAFQAGASTGISTNLAVTVPGGLTNTLVITGGIITAIQ